MKAVSLVIAAIAGDAIASASAHVHHHQHVHEKKDLVEEKIVMTVIECWLDNHVLSKGECESGIANGTLRWADDGSLQVAQSSMNRVSVAPSSAPLPPPKPSLSVASPVAPKPAVSPAPSPSSAPVVSVKPASTATPSSQVQPAPSSTKAPPKAPEPAPSPAPSSAPSSVPLPPQPSPSPPPPQLPPPQLPPPQKAPPQKDVEQPARAPRPESFIGQTAAYSNHATGAGRAFPDGELDCGHFPSAYGAMHLKWLNLGGWASVQKPNIVNSAGYDDIMTVTRDQCQGGNCCLEGAFCSYACGEGLLKYQWPSLQGIRGQSVGGLQCRNGKLHLTNPAVRTLCAPGSNKVNVYVKNNLSRNVAICRTNYPGDEKMSIPLDVQPGQTNKLACPDQAKYWTWNSKPTSAQYYINLAGYSVEKACVWGSPGDDFGNYAPANLGVSVDKTGTAYVSVMANYPTQQDVKLPYTVTIEGGNIPCRYKDGVFCRGPGYQTCDPNGCTTGATSGDLTYVLSYD